MTLEWADRVMSVHRWTIHTKRVRCSRWIFPEKWAAHAEGFDVHQKRQCIVGLMLERYTGRTREEAESKLLSALEYEKEQARARLDLAAYETRDRQAV